MDLDLLDASDAEELFETIPEGKCLDLDFEIDGEDISISACRVEEYRIEFDGDIPDEAPDFMKGSLELRDVRE